MIFNFFIVALRKIIRNGSLSFINIFGLAVGLACFWTILQYVDFERSYDRFHDKADRIFRVELDQYKNGELIFRSSENYPAVGPALQRDFPEVASFARLYNMGSKNNVVITYEQGPGEPIRFKHRRFMYADSSFLSMYSYKMISGDASTALQDPFSMVISESYAKKYFGEKNPIGKFLHMKDDDFNDELCKVTGVVQDPPDNTHLKFDVLISYKTLFKRFEKAQQRYDGSWSRKDMYTYVLLKPGVDPKALSERLTEFMKRYNPDLEKQFRRDELVLQPLTEIHLYSKLTDEPEAGGNGDSVYFLTLIAIFIVLIAWINYVNLSTARSMDRAKEVGIRKIVGADKRDLMIQFLAESFLTNVIALMISFGLVYIFWPYFLELTGTPIRFTIGTEFWFIGLVSVIIIVGSLLSGLYPAIVISSFEPVTVLKGRFISSSRGVWLRKGLVVFQFAASAALIVGTLTVYKQIAFMRNYDLGLKIEQTLVVERPGSVTNRKDRSSLVETFKSELRKSSSVREVTGSFVVPGKKLRFKPEVRQLAQASTQTVPLAFAGMDYDFMSAFGMKLIAGRNFSREFPKDQDTSVILTASASKLLGFSTPEEAIGKVLFVPDFRFSPIVVGVMADYHHESLELETQPTIFMCNVDGAEYFMIKTASEDLPATVGYVKDTWDKVFPGNPFDYFFLDDFFNRQYQADQTFGKVFGLFALLAIMIGCFGLFGLASFTVSRRVKEIAVRKICGASFLRLFYHLSKEFVILVSMASVVSWPIMYYMMKVWLSHFAYRIELSWEVFLISGLVMLSIAILTVSYQTTKAALVNPVLLLRYE